MPEIDTSNMFSAVSQAGPLFAFMMIVILFMAFAIRALYMRNIAMADNFQKIAVDSALAMNSSALANNAIARQMEIMNAK